MECLLFTILSPFGTEESIRQKVDHERQIVLWYSQHATNLAKATVLNVETQHLMHKVWE
jgi:hypothetical protein